MKKIIAILVFLSLTSACSLVKSTPGGNTIDQDLPLPISQTSTVEPMATFTRIPSSTPKPEPTPTPVPVTINAQNITSLAVLNTYGRGKIIKFKYSPDDRYFFILSTRGIFMYDTFTWEEIWFEDLGHNTASDFTFNQSGSVLYLKGGDTITSWSINQAIFYRGQLVDDSGNGDAIAINPENPELIAAASWKGATLFNYEAGDDPVRMIGHYGDVDDLAFCRRGQLLVTAGDDKSIIGWEIPTGKRGNTYTGFKERVLRVECTTDGRFIAGLDGEGNIIVFDPQTKAGTPINVPDDTLTGITLMNGSNTLAISSLSGEIRFFDMATGSLISEFHSYGPIPDEYFNLSGKYYIGEGWRYDLSFSLDDRHIATGVPEGQAVIIWDIQNSQNIKTIDGFIDGMGNHVITGDGKNLIFSDDCRMIVLDPLTLLVKHEMMLDGHISEIAISSDDEWLISSESYPDANHVIIWDLSSLEQVRSFEIPYLPKEQMIEAIQVSPDRKFAIITSNIIFTDTYNHKIVDLATGVITKVFEKYNRGVAISPDLKTLIMGNKFGVQVIGISDWKVINTIKLGKYRAKTIILTTDGNLILLKKHYSNLIGIVDSFSWSTNELNWSFSPNDRSISSITLSPDGKILASVAEGQIYFIETEYGNQMHFINDCNSGSCWGLWGILFSPDQQFFYYNSSVALNQMGIPK